MNEILAMESVVKVINSVFLEIKVPNFISLLRIRVEVDKELS